ncbi:MAG: DUF433 domain-containing protein [Planctomycetota bacterium]
MSKDEIILIDPDVQHGKPVFVGTRVPIEILFDYLETGSTIDEFRADFPGVSLAQIIALLELSRQRAVA